MARRENLEFVRDYLERMARGEVAPHMPDIRPTETARLRSRLSAEVAELGARLDELESADRRGYNENWGPLFRTGAELSHFAGQVRDFACVYTSRVSNLLHYPVDKYFQAHAERMPHEI